MAQRWPLRKQEVESIGQSRARWAPPEMHDPPSEDLERPVIWHHHPHSMRNHHLDPNLCTYACRRGLVDHAHRKRSPSAEPRVLVLGPSMRPVAVRPAHDEEVEEAEDDE